MEEHMSSMRVAHQRYKDAWATVLADFSADTDQYANDLAMDLAILSLHNLTEEFIMRCETLRANMQSPSTISAHIDQTLSFLSYNHQNYQNHMTEILAQYNIPAFGHQNNNLNNELEGFILACEYLKAFIAWEVRVPKVEVEVAPNNATAAAPVSPDNAQPRNVESETQHVNEANVSEEHEETEEHHPAALPVLPDPDTNNNA